MSQNPIEPPLADSVTESRSPSINLVDYEDVSGQPLSRSIAESRSPSINLVDYEDISGQPLSRTTSIGTQVLPEAESESEEETNATEPVKDDDMIGMAAVLLLSGIIVTGLTYFLNHPVSMENSHMLYQYL